MIKVHGNAPLVPLNNNGSYGGDFPGILHRATESANGIGYDKIVVPDSVYLVQQDTLYRMEQEIPGMIENDFTSQIQPLMGSFATPVQRVDYMEYDTNNRTPQIGVFLPDEDLPTAFGAVSVKGKLPYTNLHTINLIQSHPGTAGLSDQTKHRTILQEMTNGYIYFSSEPSDGILGQDESIINDNTNRTTLSPYDISVGFIVYQPSFKPGEKIANLMYVPSSWK